MASTVEIGTVRVNTNEPVGESEYTDETLGDLIDQFGVVSASARVWEYKAAAYSELVDTSEAGASRKLSDLHKNALTMAKLYNDKVAAETGNTSPSNRARVHDLTR